MMNISNPTQLENLTMNRVLGLVNAAPDATALGQLGGAAQTNGQQSIFAQQPQATNQQAQGVQGQGVTATTKVQAATSMAYGWLNQQNQQAQQTGLNAEKGQVSQAIQIKQPPVIVSDLGEGVNGQTNGESVTIGKQFAAKSSIAQIAATILHEFNHIAFGGGDRQDEIKAETFAENFRDQLGVGLFNNQQDIANWANTGYKHLPKSGVNIFA